MPTEPTEYKQRVERAITGLIDFLDVDPTTLERNEFYRRNDVLTYLEGRLHAERRSRPVTTNLATNIGREVLDKDTIDRRFEANTFHPEKDKEEAADDQPHEYHPVEVDVNKFYVTRIRGVTELVPQYDYKTVLEQERMIIVLERKANPSDIESFKTALKRGLRYLKMENLEQMFTYDSRGREIYIDIRNEKGKDKAFQYLAAFKEAIDPESGYTKQE